MRKFKTILSSVLLAVGTLLSQPLLATTQSTQFSTVQDMTYGSEIHIPSGEDIEGYSYIGILVERYESTPSNSQVPQPSEYNNFNLSTTAYKDKVIVDNNDVFFIPYSQITIDGGGSYYKLKYDAKQVQRSLFSSKLDLDKAGISHNIDNLSRVFRLSWYHVYRTPEGRVLAVGQDFTEYNRPYSTFFKLSPKLLDVTTKPGVYDSVTNVPINIEFSESLIVKGKLALKFKEYNKPIYLDTEYTGQTLNEIVANIKLPKDFPELNRTEAITKDKLTKFSVHLEQIELYPNSKGERGLTSSITGAPVVRVPDDLEPTQPLELEIRKGIGDSEDNVLLYDNSKPTVIPKSITLNGVPDASIGTQEILSNGETQNPVYFNKYLSSITAHVEDNGSGYNTLGVGLANSPVLVSSQLSNNNTLSPNPKPPFNLGENAVITATDISAKLTASTILQRAGLPPAYEGKIYMQASATDKAIDSTEPLLHTNSGLFAIYIDTRAPELKNIKVHSSGEIDLTVVDTGAKVKSIEIDFLDSKAYDRAVNNGKWNSTKPFYTYSVEFNHGKDTLEGFETYLTDGILTATQSILLNSDNVETFTQTVKDAYKPGYDWIIYRTVDRVGNVGYGHMSIESLSASSNFLVDIDTPLVDTYYSNLQETNNSQVNLKLRVADSLQQDTKSQNVDIYMSILNTDANNTPYTKLHNIKLNSSPITITGKGWTEFSTTVDLRNYISGTTDMDGNKLIEVYAVKTTSKEKSLSDRVPIYVHSVKPNVNLTGDSNANPLGLVTFKSALVNSMSPVVAYENTSNVATPPTFTVEGTNANWKRIDLPNTTEVSNYNGTLYYNLLVRDKAGNTTRLQKGPYTLYSDLVSYITSSKRACFVGDLTSTSKPTLLLTDEVNNPLTHMIKLNSLVQQPLINLESKLLKNGTEIARGNGSSTQLAVDFNQKVQPLDYLKYTAEYKISNGVNINTPEGSKTMEVYSIMNPIENLFNIKLSKSGSSYSISASLKPNLSSKTFANGKTLQEIVTKSYSMFGVDLVNDLYVVIASTPTSIQSTSARKLTSSTISFNGGDNAYITIGYKGKGDSVPYELQFRWDETLAGVKIINVPSSLLQTQSEFEVQLSVKHLGNTYLLPTNLTQDYIDNFETEIMIIPQNLGLYNNALTPEQNWTNLQGTSHRKDYTVKANRTIKTNGKYDIIAKVVTPFGIASYDYKPLDLLIMDNKDFLGSENSPNVLVSKTSLYNALTKKLANHSIEETQTGKVGAYELSNGNVLVFHKNSTSTGKTLIEVFDSDYQSIKKIKPSSFDCVYDVTELENIIVLATNVGLFSMDNTYNNTSPYNVSGIASSITQSVYQLEEYGSSVLIGADREDTLILARLQGDTMTYDSCKMASDLFTSVNLRAKKVKAKGSSIYVADEYDNGNVIEYTILE